MRTKAKIIEPDAVEVEITIRMTLHGWRELRSQLSGAYPSWELSRQISDVVNAVSDTFTAADPPE